MKKISAILILALMMFVIPDSKAQFTNYCPSTVSVLVDTGSVPGATVFQIKGLTNAQLQNSSYCVNLACSLCLSGGIADTSGLFGTQFVTSYVPDIVVANQKSSTVYVQRVTVCGPSTCCYIKVGTYTSATRFVGGPTVWNTSHAVSTQNGPPVESGAHLLGNGKRSKAPKPKPGK